MIRAFCAVLGALPAGLSVLVALPRPFSDHLQRVSLPDAVTTEQEWGGEASDCRALG